MLILNNMLKHQKNKLFIVIVVLLSIGIIINIGSYNNYELIYREKFSDLKVEKKQFGNEFELNDNLRRLIENIVVCHDEFDEDTDIDTSFQEHFVNHYLKNTCFEFDYLLNAYKSTGRLSRRQIEYIYWSMTAKYTVFDAITEGTVDITDTSSGYSLGELTDYDYTTSKNEIHLNGVVEITTAGYIGRRIYEFSATLSKNPYSCFDGYSITSITIEEKTSKYRS